MTETYPLDQAPLQSERSDWSPLKTVLSMVVGAALGAGVYIGAEVQHRKQHAELAPPPPAAAPVEVAKPAAAVVAPEPVPTADAAPQPPAAEDPKARAVAARTAAEQALLDEARTQLESKNASAAQATLDRMKKRFAHGSLVQERELLRIEVYKARGQLPAAKRAARKFAKSYPDSSHIDELEALTKI